MPFRLTLVLIYLTGTAYSQTTVSDSIPEKKRFGRASIELMTAQLIPWSYNYFVRDADFARITLRASATTLSPAVGRGMIMLSTQISSRIRTMVICTTVLSEPMVTISGRPLPLLSPAALFGRPRAKHIRPRQTISSTRAWAVSL